MPRHWVIVPAAGRGRRMGAEQPKQYLPLLGRTVLEWSLQPFIDCFGAAGIVVVLGTDDQWFQTLSLAGGLRTAIGGAERADSVRSGLRALDEAAEDDWVLVHDAARPCLRTEDLDALLSALVDEPVGGLLASPLADTLKQADAEQKVSATLPRAHLWRALTPQMFRYGVLDAALRRAQQRGMAVTDEAAAVEQLGHAPRLIAGHADNIKITLPEDLVLAEAILRGRQTSLVRTRIISS